MRRMSRLGSSWVIGVGGWTPSFGREVKIKIETDKGMSFPAWYVETL